MKTTRILFISSFLYLMASVLNAQLISVKSQLSSDSMMIGDQLMYKLHVEADEHVDFILPQLRDTLSGNLEILYAVSSDTLVSEGKRMVDHRYVITGFEPGMQLVPAQEVVYTTGNISDTARSMPLIINVFEPVVDTTQQIRPIKPPINTPLTFKELLPWIGVGLGSLLIIGALILLIRRYWIRKDGGEGLPVKSLEPAHVIAFRELDKLKEKKIWEKGEVKHYYTRLTEITRQYIERQYGIPAMEQTSEEIMHDFRSSNRDDSLLDEMLKELLELADLVKFAKEDPLPVDNQSNLNNAYLFVQKTYPLFYKAEPELRKEDAANE
ncbi:MAG: hypothetical protein ABFS28_01700 [Bacteroidota bacterium]